MAIGVSTANWLAYDARRARRRLHVSNASETSLSLFVAALAARSADMRPCAQTAHVLDQRT